MNVLERFKPAVPRRVLFFVAGTVWLFAGGMLIWRGEDWLRGRLLPFGLALLGGALFFRLLFLRIARRHIERIRTLPNSHPCLFSFLNWRGYILMIAMISSGMLLRTTHLVPSGVLGTLYVSMGTPLVLSSLRFIATGLRGMQSGA